MGSEKPVDDGEECDAVFGSETDYQSVVRPGSSWKRNLRAPLLPQSHARRLRHTVISGW